MKFLLVVQLIVALMMIGIILLQKSEGGGLGMGGPSSGMFTARGAANFLTRLTAILAAIFMGLCLFMTWMNRQAIHHAANIIYQEQPKS